MIALLLTDLVSSTELLQRLGDDATEELRRAHSGLLREAVSAGGGHEVKHLGTAVMVAKRLCGRAKGCQILAGDVVAGVVGTRGGHRFSSVGRLPLRA